MQSQKDRIRSHLEDGGTLSPQQALRLFGTFRLAARINDLRRDGVDIETEMILVPTRGFEVAHVARYSLKGGK